MDEFGVLVESIGFKAHGKSAPMAKLKPKPKSHFTTHNTSSFHDPSSLPIDELDGIFRSNVDISKTGQSQNAFVVDDDIFGGPVSSSNQYGGVDLESVFSVGSNGYGDLLGSKPKQRDPVDDLFGSFGLNGSVNQAKKAAGFDDLISGFGGASQPNNRVYSEAKSNGRPSNSSSTGVDDPFSVFEPSISQSDASWPVNEPSDQSKVKKSSVQSNGFGNFVMAGPPKSGSKVGARTNTVTKPSPRTSSNGFANADYVDAIFGGSNAAKRNNNATRPSSTAQNSLFDGFFHEEEHNVKQTSTQSTFSAKKTSSPPSIGNDFTSLFGDVTTSSGEFHEIEGEPAERRRARLKRHMKTNERMAEALAEKNQRDLQTQNEQDEKRRLADTLDSDIKRWAAGKEGNLRALLSSLQQVLGPESGWRAVPLTDMITSESVRKVYKKATLYVHPDKVQQRGANLHQKYVAEKVFDILKLWLQPELMAVRRLSNRTVTSLSSRQPTRLIIAQNTNLKGKRRTNLVQRNCDKILNTICNVQNTCNLCYEKENY